MQLFLIVKLLLFPPGHGGSKNDSPSQEWFDANGMSIYSVFPLILIQATKQVNINIVKWKCSDIIAYILYNSTYEN